MPKKKREPKKTQYVIGREIEEHEPDHFHAYWLVPCEKGEMADEQNIEMALRFDSREGTQRAAEEQRLTVFEIVDERTWPAKLKEV